MDIQRLDTKYSIQIKMKCSNNDTEIDHVNADNIICKLLEELGFNKTLDAYCNVDKWFA